MLGRPGDMPSEILFVPFVIAVVVLVFLLWRGRDSLSDSEIIDRERSFTRTDPNTTRAERWFHTLTGRHWRRH